MKTTTNLLETKKYYLWEKLPKLEEKDNNKFDNEENKIKTNNKTTLSSFNNEKIVPPIPKSLWNKNFQESIKNSDNNVEKVTKNALNSPFVPLGMAATVGCLIGMCVATYKKDRLKAQFYMRGRIAAQFFTICTLVGGAWYLANKNVTDKKKNLENKLNSS